MRAQCPPPNFPDSGNTCPEAPVLCQNIDGYCNTINNNNIQQPFPGCSSGWTLNNDEWFAFVAGTTSLTIQVTPSNCTMSGNLSGLQGGIYHGCGGTVMDVQCQCTTDAFILTSNAYVVGDIYWFVLDGCNGDVCDYHIDVLDGFTMTSPLDDPAPIEGDSVVCAFSTSVYSVPPVDGATEYHWWFDPQNVGTVTGFNSNQLTVDWTGNVQSTTLYLYASNPCHPSSDTVVKHIEVIPRPVAHLNGGGSICPGFAPTINLQVDFGGVGPWIFTPALNGTPQTPIQTAANPYVFPVDQVGVWSVADVTDVAHHCPGLGFGEAQILAATIPTFNLQICPGETLTFGNHVFTQPGVYYDTLQNGVDCSDLLRFNVVALPQPTRNDTIRFCPGSSVTINGQTYTQPGTVTETIQAVAGCDTLLTHLLEYIPLNASTVKIQCPQNIAIIPPNPGTGPVAVNYPQPTASSDCVCPGTALTLTEGLPSGGAFPNGLTKVCYQASDNCGQTATCCFEVMVREVQPCDIKVNGCMRYELLTITADPGHNLTYRIRVVNNCNNKLIYSAFQFPNGVIANSPADFSIFNSEGQRQYQVRNPNFSPFYSVRFKTTTDSISNGESDIFKYTLPAQTAPDYIHVISRLATQVYYEAHLNTFYCPIGITPSNRNDAEQEFLFREHLQLFPNPSEGKLWVDVSAWENAAVSLRIFNSQGEQVFTQTVNEPDQLLLIELSETLPNGLYFIEAGGGDGKREALPFLLQR